MPVVRLVSLSVIALMFSGAASAATLEVPLQFTTPSDPWTPVVDEVEAEIPDAPITSIAVRLTGTWIDQSYWCMYPYVNEYARARIEVLLGDDVGGAPPLVAMHTFPASGEQQPFDIEIVLLENGAESLGFLADGVFEAGLVNRPIQGVYWESWPCSALNIPVRVDEATLRIEYDSGVPATRRSWSTLKQSWD